MTNKYKSEYRKTISKYNGNCSNCGIKIIANITQNIICRFVLGLWLGMLCLDCGTKGKDQRYSRKGTKGKGVKI